MDTTGDPDIRFDKDGICNYYYEYNEKLRIRIPSSEIAAKRLESIVASIKKSGKGKQYDCSGISEVAFNSPGQLLIFGTHDAVSAKIKAGQ